MGGERRRENAAALSLEDDLADRVHQGAQGLEKSELPPRRHADGLGCNRPRQVWCRNSKFRCAVRQTGSIGRSGAARRAASAAYYGIYKTAALTALMKKAPGNKLPIAKAKKLMVSQFKEPKTSKKAFQGFDIKGDGAKLKYLYVFRGYVGQTPTIYLYSWRNGGEVAKRGKRVIESKSTDGLKLKASRLKPIRWTPGAYTFKSDSIRLDATVRTDGSSGCTVWRNPPLGLKAGVPPRSFPLLPRGGSPEPEGNKPQAGGPVPGLEFVDR